MCIEYLRYIVCDLELFCVTKVVGVELEVSYREE